MAAKRGVKPGTINNRSGKGGFQERPQDIHPGGWRVEDSIGHQYRMLIKLTVEEFKAWKDKHRPNTRTVAQEIAYGAVMASKTRIRYLEELTDRTEGKAPQTFVGELKTIFDDEQVDKIADRIAGRKK